MPREKAVQPTVLVKAWIPAELKAKLYLYLHSEIESRIPHGKVSEFVADRLREFFGWKQLDLKPYGFAPGYFVRGPKDMIEALQQVLAERQL